MRLFLPIMVLLAALLSLPATYGAGSAINGEVFVAAGTSGTNALPSSRMTNMAVTATSTATNGATAYLFDTSVAHTSGNLVEVKNNGTNYLQLLSDGEMQLGPNSDGLLLSGAANFLEVYGRIPAAFGFDLYADATTSYLDLGPGLATLNPTIADGQTPVLLNTSLSHTSGNLAEIKNNGTNVVQITATTATSTNTPFILLINGTQKPVYLGPTDSGGTGFRHLIVTN